MTSMTHPAEDNQFLAGHIALFRRSLIHWTGRDLVNPRMTNVEAARYLFSASFALLSHDTQPDPVFNYANQTALSLFAMSWEEMTSCPSRLSAERDNQADRARLLQEVTENGYSHSTAWLASCCPIMCVASGPWGMGIRIIQPVGARSNGCSPWFGQTRTMVLGTPEAG